MTDFLEGCRAGTLLVELEDEDDLPEPDDDDEENEDENRDDQDFEEAMVRVNVLLGDYSIVVVLDTDTYLFLICYRRKKSTSLVVGAGGCGMTTLF